MHVTAPASSCRIHISHHPASLPSPLLRCSPAAQPTGTFATWQFECEPLRPRCVNLALASRGYQVRHAAAVSRRSQSRTSGRSVGSGLQLLCCACCCPACCCPACCCLNIASLCPHAHQEQRPANILPTPVSTAFHPPQPPLHPPPPLHPQCMTMDWASCCLTPDGKHCAPIDSEEDTVSADGSWQGERPLSLQELAAQADAALMAGAAGPAVVAPAPAAAPVSPEAMPATTGLPTPQPADGQPAAVAAAPLPQPATQQPAQQPAAMAAAAAPASSTQQPVQQQVVPATAAAAAPVPAAQQGAQPAQQQPASVPAAAAPQPSTQQPQPAAQQQPAVQEPASATVPQPAATASQAATQQAQQAVQQQPVALPAAAPTPATPAAQATAARATGRKLLRGQPAQ